MSLSDRVRPEGSEKSQNQVYRINPERQELDWEKYTSFWKEFYISLSFLVFLSILIFKEATEFEWVLFLVYAIFVMVLIFIPMLRFATNKIVSARLKKRNIYFEKKNDRFGFFEEGEVLFSTPPENIQSIKIYERKNGSMLHVDAGFGFVFEETEKITASDEFCSRMQSDQEDLNVHYMLDSTSVGTQRQNEDFECWLQSIGFGARMEKNYFDDLEKQEMSREDWLMILFATLLLLLGLGAIVQSLFFS